jgi:penicillin-binding protein-related factor A (putative recombinase)
LSNPGKEFESDIESSAVKQGLFVDRIKDTHIPNDLRNRVKVAKNKYDFYLYSRPLLFSLELKSTGGKSVSFDEKIIKKHQIDNLQKASTYDGVVAGFIFNFRSADNRTFFVPINEFIKYKMIAQSSFSIHNYQSKLNKSSIPIGICEEVGIEIGSELKKKRYTYDVKRFIDEAVVRFG